MNVVRYVGKAKTLSSEYLASLEADSGYTVVDTLLHGGNVTIRAELDGKAVRFSAGALTRDFIDLCTLVYIADETSKREEAVDGWTREFNVLAPVSTPKTWEVNEDEFAGMLRTLGGDNYSFSWCQRPNLAGFGDHNIAVPPGYDSVCLFSGGIDSFLGAYRILSEGQRLLLVGHQADGTAAAAQTALAAELRKLFPGKLRLIQFRVARSFKTDFRYPLPEKCEETHRPRSLLFLALAVTIANGVKIQRIYIPENGLIALNPPLGKSRLGTLSTRTAHPKYLTELANFLDATSIFQGSIKNPFLFLSKTDMLKNLNPALRAATLRSVSCARPSRYKELGVRHCGYCVPCIYRRIAFIDSGLDAPKDYAFDVFKNLPSIETSKQIDFRSLVMFAKKMMKAGTLEKELVVLSHGYFPLSVGERFGEDVVNSYDVWGDMLTRWSVDFLEKLKALTPKATKRLLGL